MTFGSQSLTVGQEDDVFGDVLFEYKMLPSFASL